MVNVVAIKNGMDGRSLGLGSFVCLSPEIPRRGHIIAI